MALRPINWKKADYQALRKAVNRFNRILDNVADREASMLPEKLNYNQVKSEIFTRKGLNEKIRAFNRLTEENATKIHESKTGIKISQYYWNEVGLAEKRWKTKINKELERYQIPREGEAGTRVSMGNRTAMNLLKNKERNIKKELNYEETSTVFNRKFQALMNRGSEDKVYQKTLQYKENYLNLMKENYSTYDNYKKFLEKVENMSAEEFYRFMQQDELSEDLYYQSQQEYNENEFNSFLQSLGII